MQGQRQIQRQIQTQIQGQRQIQSSENTKDVLYFRKAEGARISNMTFLSCKKYNDKDKYKDKYKDKD